MLFVVLMLFQLRRVTSCPTTCNCYRWKTNCRNASLNAVPSNISESVRIFDVASNNISTLHNRDLISLKNLEIIFLDNNGIVKLEPYIFKETSELRHIYLNNNKLISINLNVFQFTKKLRYLYLQNNEIRYISPNLFAHNKDLVMLDISGNQIQNFEPDTFHKNPILSWVHVKSNPLKLPLEWQTLLNNSLNVLEMDFCSEPGPTLSAILNVPSLKHIQAIQRSNVSLDEFTSYQTVHGLDHNEIEYIKYKIFHDLYSMSYGMTSVLTIGEERNVFTLEDDSVLCYCGQHSVWFWCDEQQTNCAKTVTKSDKYKFLSCDAQHEDVLLTSRDNEGTTDSDRRRKSLWSTLNRSVSAKTIRNTLLYASIPGCIIIIVASASVVRFIKRRRAKERERIRNSLVYSELSSISPNS